jgi:hypothetical protein
MICMVRGAKPFMCVSAEPEGAKSTGFRPNSPGHLLKKYNDMMYHQIPDHHGMST